MEKIKLQLLQIAPMKNKIIKLGKHKINIKPYISSENIVLITDLCLKKMISDDTNLGNSALIHTIFDMCVVVLCTNIQVDGIKLTEDNGKSIELNLDSSNFEVFDALGLDILIKNNITNYDRCWQTVFEIMQIVSINNTLGLIAQNIPSEKSLENTVKQLGDAVAEINKKDPETLKNIVRIAGENNAFAKGKTEFNEKKNAEKKERLDKAIKDKLNKIKIKK